MIIQLLKINFEAMDFNQFMAFLMVYVFFITFVLHCLAQSLSK